MMGDVSKPPFADIYSAFAYIRHCNPARAKSVNLLEPEGAGASDRSIEYGNDWLFGTALAIISKVLKDNDDPRTKRMFEMLHLEEYERDEILELFRIHRNTLRNNMRRLEELIEKRMIDCRLIPH